MKDVGWSGTPGVAEPIRSLRVPDTFATYCVRQATFLRTRATVARLLHPWGTSRTLEYTWGAHSWTNH